MIVYHYCSLDVFTKIISGKSIRLSDITKSNDSMEILWITKYIEEIFDEEFQKETEKTKYFKEDYPKDIFTELREHYSKEFFDEKQKLYSYFVCCFSEKGDLLSQWRGYADDGNGIAIGFDADMLKQIGKPDINDNISADVFNFDKIEYSERSQKSQIRKIAVDLIIDLKEVAKRKSPNLKQDSMKAYNKCFLKLFNLSIFMKNPFFSEEQEWRICHWTQITPKNKTSNIHINGGVTLSDIGYHMRQDDMIPHIDLKFEKCVESMIKEIVIGPKCNVRENDIKTYLASNGIECPVIKSNGTYR